MANSLEKYVKSLNQKKEPLNKNVQQIGKGEIGFDNPRENIDPQIKTEKIMTKAGTIENTPVNAKDIVNKSYADAGDLWQVSGSNLLPILPSRFVEIPYRLGGGVNSKFFS